MISDAVHEGGTSGFFFLPPMVAQPTVSGTFDADIATLNPQIAICDVTNDVNCGGSSGTLAIFSTATSPAITVDPAAQQYQVNWDTKGASFVAGKTYRVHVTAGVPGARRELGFADVLLTTTPGQAKFLQSGDIIVLPDGRNLPIHFRIETGIPGSLAMSEATARVATGGTDLITAAVSDLHGAPLAGVAVAWSLATTPASGVADAAQPLNPTSGQTGTAGTTVTTFRAGTTAGAATITAATGGLAATVDVTVLGGLSFAAVSAGFNHTCGVTTAGAAYCWGHNIEGQLGDGTRTDRTSPVAVLRGLSFAAMSAGFSHTCGVTTAGAAYCWGAGVDGELGDGNATNWTFPVAVLGGLSFAAVSAGFLYTCGVTTTDVAYCWGRGGNGNLGDGSATSRTSPVAVVGGLSFAAVSAGVFGHTCGVTTAGAAFCWGYNLEYQLGDGTTTDRTSPVAVLGGLSFAAVSAGYRYTCGVTTAGAAYCWGNNTFGQLGDGTTTDRTSPVAVLGGLSFAAVNAGEFGHICGVTTAGAAYCWGDNRSGQLGDETTTFRTSPVAVLGGLSFAAVSAGELHTCGLTTAGTVYCWGSNASGQLGDGTTTDSHVPVRVVQ